MNNSSSNNSRTGNESIYLVDGETGDDEVERVIGISVMGVNGAEGGVFSFHFEEGRDAADLVEFKKQWVGWLGEMFRDQLSDTFMEVYAASAEMRIERVVKLDKRLDQRLNAGEGERSRRAGAWFLEGKNEMRRAPQWQKYARCVEQGKCPGHVVTTFALQASLYHLPLLSALTSYVYFEWRAGIRAFSEGGGTPKVESSLQTFQQQFPESVQMVREVFAGDFQAKRSISAL